MPNADQYQINAIKILEMIQNSTILIGIDQYWSALGIDQGNPDTWIKHELVIMQILCKHYNINIPILPEAILTFASKSSVGPSYVANGQEDHKTYTNSNKDNVIMTNYCYFEIIAQCMGLLRNV